MDNMLDFDVTFFIQLINFIVTLVVLNYLLIKPIRKQIAERSDLFARYSSDTIKFNESATNKLRMYEKALQEARENATQVKEKIKQAALEEERLLIEKAQKEAQSFLRDTKSQIQKEKKVAEEKLFGVVDTFAKLVQDKALS